MSLMVFFVLTVLGLILAVIGGIMNLVFAFQENIWWGIAVFLFPFASIIFTITSWNRKGVRRAFFFGLGGFLAITVGYTGLSISNPDLSRELAVQSRKDNTQIVFRSDDSGSLSPDLVSDKTDRFYNGVTQATTAATLTQNAKSKTDWTVIVTHWEQAIALMDAVPMGDPNYDVAQTKVTEYQKNLAYAQKNTN